MSDPVIHRQPLDVAVPAPRATRGGARGYFGIAVSRPKTASNVGTLWRSANVFGASFLAVVGGRYHKQSSDTMQTPRHVPLYEYDTFDDFYAHIPHGCQLIGVEVCDGARSLPGYGHPERAVYLLGPEDGSLTAAELLRCHSRIIIPGSRCLNLAVAGSVVAYDRISKAEQSARMTAVGRTTDQASHIEGQPPALRSHETP